MVKKKGRIKKILEKEVPFPRLFRIEIKGKRWEEVASVKHPIEARLIRAYWKTMGFETRVRKLKRGKKRYEVDIKNFVTTTKFPTAKRLELAKKSKLRGVT